MAILIKFIRKINNRYMIKKSNKRGIVKIHLKNWPNKFSKLTPKIISMKNSRKCEIYWLIEKMQRTELLLFNRNHKLIDLPAKIIQEKKLNRMKNKFQDPIVTWKMKAILLKNGSVVIHATNGEKLKTNKPPKQ